MGNKYRNHSRTRQCRSCLAKKKYATAKEAEAAMVRAGAHDFYKCCFCDGWHLTTQMPRGNQVGAKAVEVARARY